MGSGDGYRSKLDMTIVGVMEDAKYSEVKQKVPPQFFMAYRQDKQPGGMHVYVRTSGDIAQAASAITAVVKRLDPNLPIEELETLPAQVRNNTFLDRMMTTLSAAFALLATLLAAIGLYGVLAYTVAQRTREIGLRMALGAAPDRVRGMVLRQVATMTLVGTLVGLAGARAVGKGAQSILFEMTGADPAVLALSAVALALAALCAGFIPAHRASRAGSDEGVEIRIASRASVESRTTSRPRSLTIPIALRRRSHAASSNKVYPHCVRADTHAIIVVVAVRMKPYSSGVEEKLFGGARVGAQDKTHRSRCRESHCCHREGGATE